MATQLLILSNPVLVSCLVSVVVAQLIKTAFAWKENGRFHWRYLFLAAHMPSSHTATVTALSLSLILTEGLSTLSIATLIFSFIIIRDVIGDKAFAQHQEDVMNEMFDKITQGQFEELAWDDLIGHTGREVIAGLAIGVSITAIVFSSL